MELRIIELRSGTCKMVLTAVNILCRTLKLIGLW